MPEPTRLRITEIFHSLQGESLSAGCPTVFVRLTGCPLRCGYCDTTYAFTGGEWMGLDEILARVETFEIPYVTVTGGEPLAQKPCLDLLQRLCDANYRVSLETSGAIDVSQVDQRVSRVVDIKTPDSGEVERNLWGNLDVLNKHDQVKFVICSRGDYDWALNEIRARDLEQKFLESPNITDVDTLIADDYKVWRFQVDTEKALRRGIFASNKTTFVLNERTMPGIMITAGYEQYPSLEKIIKTESEF